MNDGFPLSISVGNIAFGLWITASANRHSVSVEDGKRQS